MERLTNVAEFQMAAGIVYSLWDYGGQEVRVRCVCTRVLDLARCRQ